MRPPPQPDEVLLALAQVADLALADDAILTAGERAHVASLVISHKRAQRKAGLLLLHTLLPEGARVEVAAERAPRISCPGLVLKASITHCGDWVAVAVAREATVGIDLERIRVDRDPLPLALRQFGAKAVAALEALPPAERAEAFTRQWTLAEAYGKATGEGIGFAPPEVPLGDPGWTFVHWPAPQGYLGALAVQRRPIRLLLERAP